jgi:hypothetical protein
MVFREVSVIEIREVLRAWLAGRSERAVAAQAGVDRKTSKRYVTAAVAAGLSREGGEEQLTDELIGQVVSVVRPVRPDGHGQGWAELEARQQQVIAWVKADVPVATEASDQVAVLAAVVGQFPASLLDVTPSHAVSAILIHGTADSVASIEGGYSRHRGPNGELRGRALSLEESAARWRAIDRCRLAPARRTRPSCRADKPPRPESGGRE